MFLNFLKTLLLKLVVGIFFGFFSANPLFAGGWESERIEIENHLVANECNKAWELLWPHLKSHNRQAFGIFAKTIITKDKFSLPNLPDDRLAMLRYAQIGLFHSLGTDSNNDKNWAKSLVRGLSSELAGSQIDGCLKSKPEQCRQMAVKFGIIPRIDDFVDELSKAEIVVDKSIACTEQERNKL